MWCATSESCDRPAAIAKSRLIQCIRIIQGGVDAEVLTLRRMRVRMVLSGNDFPDASHTGRGVHANLKVPFRFTEIAGAPSLPRRIVRQQYVGAHPPVAPSSARQGVSVPAPHTGMWNARREFIPAHKSYEQSCYFI